MWRWVSNFLNIKLHFMNIKLRFVNINLRFHFPLLTACRHERFLSFSQGAISAWSLERPRPALPHVSAQSV